jgi:transcriptional regulator with XRE-family HTH domain
MDNIGLSIKQTRRKHNVSQIVLAKYLGIDRTTLSHYESGHRIPSITTLWKIADYFNVTIDELIGR